MELKEKVRILIAEINKTHRYSMSQIYGLYNEVFSLSEIPQSCASCLIRKVNQLKSWLAEQDQMLENNKSTDIEEAKPKKRGRKAKQTA